MSLDNAPRYSGGCQCGAVRFRVEGALGDASICHCRMCQKASGNFYQPLVSVRGARLDLDARRAEDASSRRTMPGAASAANAARRSPTRRRTAWRWRSPPSTIRRRSCRRSSGASRRSCPMSTAIPALPGEDTMADQDAAGFLADARLLPAPRLRHRPMAAGGQDMSERITGGCQCGAVRYRASGRSPTTPTSAIAACARRRSASSSPRWSAAPKEAVELDARRARGVPELRACRARLLPRLRHAALLP